MVEPIAHFLIPTLILLAFLPQTDRKLILKWSPLAIVSDFDFFIGHLYLFHNLIFAMGIPTFIYLYSKNKQYSLVAFYLIGSHLLLDTFGPGVGFFYPFYDSLFRFDFYLYASPATGALSYKAGGMMQALSEATKDQLSPVVTPLGVILVALVSVVTILKKNS